MLKIGEGNNGPLQNSPKTQCEISTLMNTWRMSSFTLALDVFVTDVDLMWICIIICKKEATKRSTSHEDPELHTIIQKTAFKNEPFSGIFQCSFVLFHVDVPS
ncbi:hypothetical protein TNCV_1457391 [Trichonephila clavipes]|nr:hypothetical protein TNCV_1457391 [Trichonephila clavipes]